MNLLPDKDNLLLWPLTDLHLPQATTRPIAENRALQQRADLVVFLGDMVRCYATDDEYRHVRAMVEALGTVPHIAVSGNHEWYFEEFDEQSGIYGEIWAQASNQEQRTKIEKFKHFWGLDSLWTAQSHPLGHFVFLSLDNVESQKQEALSEEQLAFLGEQVAIAGQKPLFIFCHAPVMLEKRLDLVYYEPARTACIELQGSLKQKFLQRKAPSFWMSGHIHLHPDHYLFAPYRAGGNLWQIHCPDSRGYGRWLREHYLPQRYSQIFSRLLQIDKNGVTFITHEHQKQDDIARFRVDF